MTPSALKRSWADFNWKFWQDDGMRGTPSDEDGDIDPHYKEMLKVRTYHDVLNLAYQRATCSIQMLRIAGTTIPCYFLMQRLPPKNQHWQMLAKRQQTSGHVGKPVSIRPQ
jgi:hypothetical protein